MLNLFERNAPFFDLFDELAGHVASATEHLQRLAAGFPASGPEIGVIGGFKRDADAAGRRLVERLNHSFLPPIDADDVHALVGALGDVVDAVDAVARRFSTYHVEAVEPLFVEQAGVLVRAAAAVREAVGRLRASRKLSDLRETLIEIHRLESLGDDNHHRALASLFDGSRPVLFVMKWKELYALVEQAIDDCEDVGNVVERTVLKIGH